MCFHNSLLPEEEGGWASWFGFVKWARYVEGMKWCPKEEDEAWPTRMRKDGNSLMKLED